MSNALALIVSLSLMSIILTGCPHGSGKVVPKSNTKPAPGSILLEDGSWIKVNDVAAMDVATLGTRQVLGILAYDIAGKPYCSGNSFPEIFLRSYECKNPNCVERSKSGRGKRFDEFGVYRYFKLTENKKENEISEELFSKWRRDIFSNPNDIYEMLINYYAWDNEKICFTKNINIKNLNSRKKINYTFFGASKYNSDFEKIPIVKFFSKIAKLLSETSECNETRRLNSNIEILNENSTEKIQSLVKNQIGCAITSPPYYNAREYSFWSNMILYFIDMQRNAKSVFDVMCKDGYYLYNIGDIVNADNIYVESNMSKKRLQLGFLSCLIFEKIGFNLVGNIIWDKGEVQSKRNSTMNRNSGYVKCINCYEHIFVFKKGAETKIISDVKKNYACNKNQFERRKHLQAYSTLSA